MENRIAALRIAKLLLQQEQQKEQADQPRQISSELTAITCPSVVLSWEELEKALAPIGSILHKCRAAQVKHEEASATFRRLQKHIDVMVLAEALIRKELNMKMTGKPAKGS